MGAESVTEYEHKFLVNDRAVFDQLLQVQSVGDFVFESFRKEPHCDLYIDTGNYSLYNIGSAARIRKSNSAMEFTLKLPRPLRNMRTELSEKIEPSILPELFNNHSALSSLELYRELYRIISGAQLHPFAMGYCDRTTIRLAYITKRINLSVDEWTLKIPDVIKREMIWLTPEREVEIERGSNAGMKNVDEVAGIIKSKWSKALEPSKSKFARAVEKTRARYIRPDLQKELLLRAFEETSFKQ